TMHQHNYTQHDFARAPLMFYYETTLACDLVCKHCRASAQENAHPQELNTKAAKALIDQVASFERTPTVVLTGGDPLKRPDLFELIGYARERGLQVALTPSATPLATREAFQRARDAGVHALGISLDGADAQTHDAFRAWEGSFARTMEMLKNARELNLAVQINTTVCRRNVHQIDAIADLLAEQGIAMWAVFFLVPVGRGIDQPRISAEEYEEVFGKLWAQAQRRPYAVKTTEAPHYRRYVLQHGGDPLAEPHGNERPSEKQRQRRAPLGVGDGKGIMFVSHIGEIFPAGFLPIRCGRFPRDSVVDVYQNHPTFLALRDPDRFKGRCGACEYRHICGGSRARAYSVTGDFMAAEPDCIYTPKGFSED
ncbi:MAG: TIGR04053 family radical SAM/SPASM domain-containing protein, partial [Thermoguttaceae bacterium]